MAFSTLDPEKLGEIERRADAATAGPWESDGI
jgi:hypothetical protein